ncbi:MAG: hypothetical protein HQM12_20095 [SAR324 cluster bacterium]|nr:hypothetical protein [SAR324 cluster bacterium]
MNQDIEKFLEALEQLNKRDALIARLLWETGLKRDKIFNLSSDAVRVKGRKRHRTKRTCHKHKHLTEKE